MTPAVDRTKKSPTSPATMIPAAGRTKGSFELTGYEEPLQKVIDVIKNVVIAIFACVLFSGSCSLYSAQVPPMVDGVPLFSRVGFALSIALAVYSVKKLIKAAGK